MAQVWVRNKNEHPYREKFQDRWVEIPAKDAIKMDHDEARQFVSRCNGVLKDGDGQPDPRGFKMLFIEKLDGEAAEPVSNIRYVSHIDGKEFGSKKELETHLKQFKDRVVVDENAERELAAREKTTRPRGQRTGAA